MMRDGLRCPSIRILKCVRKLICDLRNIVTVMSWLNNSEATSTLSCFIHASTLLQIDVLVA